jgi:hypothetical protein
MEVNGTGACGWRKKNYMRPEEDRDGGMEGGREREPTCWRTWAFIMFT